MCVKNINLTGVANPYALRRVLRTGTGHCGAIREPGTAIGHRPLPASNGVYGFI